MLLFHKDVYMPKFTLPNRVVALRYGAHALNAAQNDEKMVLTPYLPKSINPSLLEVIEAEFDPIARRAVKFVVRYPATATLDLVIVWNVADGFVRTVWGNWKADTHRNLDRSRYAKSLNG